MTNPSTLRALALPLTLALSLAACESTETVSSGSTSQYPSGEWESKSSLLIAEPEILDCTFVERTEVSTERQLRNGQTIGFEGDAPPIRITCDQDGYHPYTKVVHAQMSGKAAALSFFVGGLAMVAGNSSAGVGMLYPKQIVIRLEPESFPSEAARDAWYDERKEEVRREREQEMQWDLGTCDEQRCDDQRSDLESKLETELRAMEERRKSARIAGQ